MQTRQIKVKNLRPAMILVDPNRRNYDGSEWAKPIVEILHTPINGKNGKRVEIAVGALILVKCANDLVTVADLTVNA